MARIIGTISSSVLKQAAASNFMAIMSPDTSKDVQAWGINTLSNGNIVVGTTTAQGGNSYIATIDQGTVSLIAGKYMNDAAGNAVIQVDSSDNILCANGKQTAAYYMKLDSSLSIVSQKNESVNFIQALKLDPTNNVLYMSGYTAGSPYDGYLLKVNKDGVIQAQTQIQSPTPRDHLTYGIAVPSSGSNVYICGFTKGGRQGYVASINSSLNSFNWQLETGSYPSTNYLPSSATIGPSDSLLTSGNGAGGTQNALTTTKYDSSGNMVWARIFTNGANAIGTNGYQSIDTDSSNNIYVAGSGFFNGYSTEAFLAKYNSSGTLQWQRKMACSDKSMAFNSLKVVGNNIYVVGYLNYNPARAFIACVPTDGSLTGTYSLSGSSITYSAASATEGAQSWTAITGTNSFVSSSVSASTTSFTATSNTGNVAKVLIS